MGWGIMVQLPAGTGDFFLQRVHPTLEAQSVGVPSFVQYGALMCPWAQDACIQHRAIWSTSLLQVPCSPASNISWWDSINIVSKYMFIL